MAEKKRDVLEPAFNGGLLDARYLKGGFFVRKTIIQRNQIGLLFRVLDGIYSTMCFVSADNTLYELINNPGSATTANSDWRIALQIESGLTPIGSWDATNTDPVLLDTDSIGIRGSFYIVTGAASPILVTYAGLFGGASQTVKNGDLIVSNGAVWFVSALSITWDTLDKPSVIVDYVNGTVISHSHTINDITGLQGALDDKFDEGDVAPLDIDFNSIPDTNIISLGFIKQYYYRKSEVYSKDEIDGLLPDLTNYYTKNQVDLLDISLYDAVLTQVSTDYYNKTTVDIKISTALSSIPGVIIGEVTLAGRDALVGGVSSLNGYLLKKPYRVVTTDPDLSKWVDEFTGNNGDFGNTFWVRVYSFAASIAAGTLVSLPDGFDASAGDYPENIGTGSLGAILRGNVFDVTVSSLPDINGNVKFPAGCTLRSLQDLPGQNDAKWKINY